jgi:cysteine-rich repeat protein
LREVVRMKGFRERSARAGRTKYGAALALSLAMLASAPSYALAACGDTIVEIGEECDDGNVSGGDCCAADCSFEGGGAECPDDGEACTWDVCDGAGTCIHPAGHTNTVCRPDGTTAGLGAVSAGELELPVALSSAALEVLNCGNSLQFYPIDANSCVAWHVYNTVPASAANLKAKVQGIRAGTYTPPAATGGSAFNFVGGTIASAFADIRALYDARKDANGEWVVRVPVFLASDCSQFSSPLQILGFATVRVTMDLMTINGVIECVTTTGTPGPYDFGTVIGTHAECDVPERCDGVNPTCPADAFEPAGRACTADASACTVDACDGSGVCAHSGGNVGTACRASAGACDVAETCAGLKSCPVDAKSTAVCRPAGGVCDLAETCSGTANACPVDAKSTATCRPKAGVCDVAAEVCTGANNECPTDVIAGSGTTCRESAGACDPAETCDGASAACPVDARGSAVCRESAGVCDVAETCDGASAVCPADAFASGTPCRNTAGVCDVAETCDGVSAGCPADGSAAGVLCRSSTGECDAAESCTGASAACPADSIAPAGSPCGDTTATDCTAPDTCDMDGECQANNYLPGTPCEDDELCTTGDTCNTDGNCNSGTLPACDDGNPCTADECAPETGDCTSVTRPAAGCLSAGKSSLSISTRGDGKARWKWTRGEETTCEDLGAPDADTGYDVCIYDGTGGGDYDLAAHFALPASGLWERGSDCRWSYKDSSGATDGITSIKMTPREAGRASIQLMAEGETAPLPAAVAADRFLNADPDVTVQIVNSAGACWESRLTDERKNTGDSYKGTGAVEIGAAGWESSARAEGRANRSLVP